MDQRSDGVPYHITSIPLLRDVGWFRIEIFIQCGYAFDEVFDLASNGVHFLHTGSSNGNFE